QSSMTEHFQSLEPGKKEVSFMNKLFVDATHQWLIQTDQIHKLPLSQIFFFIAWIATNEIILPSAKITQEAIITLFKKQMTHL
ncbi:hypothetical protein EDD85DRAFT_752053, partial [Armillaria nabsnona]